MSKLQLKPKTPVDNGKILEVTPETAGWHYIGFKVHSLKKGESINSKTDDKEICLVLLSGKANVKTQNHNFNDIGERMSVFEKNPPYAVYVTTGDYYEVEAITNLEIAVCEAPGNGTYTTRLIAPDNITQSDRGSGKMERRIHDILPEGKDADTLLITEVYTPDGNTSSFPPHRHDRENLPAETYLEETYYHELNPSNGFAFQRVYNDDKSLDEAIAIEHRDVVLVPEGYHPVSCVPGYELYYLNVMEGPVRTWKFHNAPEHEWIFDK